MLMIVLMVFGLAILTTTLSNRNLSEKKQEWLKNYYKLESKVALELAEIDNTVQSIKEKVVFESDESTDKTVLFIELLREEMNDLVVEDQNVVLEFDIEEAEGDYLKHIIVKVKFIIPDRKLSDSEYLRKENYEIVKYSETQDLFEYEDIKFGNPFTPESDD